MERHYPDWKILPAEILTEIFHFAVAQQEQEDSTNFALVCKAWRNPAQSSLYSHVTIYTILQLENFRDIIECNSYFGAKVKVLDLQIYSIKDSTVEDLHAILTNLLSNHLPNLEFLYQVSYISYIPILNALLDSKLKHLKRVPLPELEEEDEETYAHYASCTFMLRNRLEEVNILDMLPLFVKEGVMSQVAMSNFQQLYNNLDQFDKLTTITIDNQTEDGVQVLEHIVESCRSLRDIYFTFNFLNSQNKSTQLNKIIDSDMKSSYSPRSNIKVLHGALSTLDSGNSLLLYIIQKFSHLKKLHFQLDEASYVPTHILLGLFNYLSGIKTFSVCDIPASQVDINEAIESYWSTTSRYGVENVCLLYSDGNIDSKTLLDINNIYGEEGFSLKSLIRNVPDWQPCMDFIKMNGKYIGDLSFSIDIYKFYSFSCPPENLLGHIFTYCPYLRTLNMDQCPLKPFMYSTIETINTHSIDKITLFECDIEPGTLEQLSMILSEIREFRLSCTQCNTGKEDHVMRIIMPHTRILNIAIWKTEYFTSTVYVKIFVVTDKKCYYYKFRSGDKKVINAKEFEEGNDHEQMSDEEAKDEERQLIYICCQMKPELTVGST